MLDVSSSDLEPYLLALVSALAFFASILLHELGHAFVAMRRGIGISDITLWMFGGVARMTRDSDSPGTEFKVAIGGPLVTLAIALACVGIGIAAAGSDEFWRAMRFDEGADTSGILAVIAWLAQHQPAGPRLQPDPRLPAGRRADRAGDRLAGERGPQPGNARRRRASGRPSPTCSSASASCCSSRAT